MNTIKRILLLVVTIVAIHTTNAQTKVGAVTLPNSLTYGADNLDLNGAGIRKKMAFIKLYSGGLYLQSKSKDASAIVNSDETMAIRLVITSGFVSSSAMSDAVEDGFEASTGGDKSAITSEIEKFKGFFSDEIVEDDIFDITYQKGKGVVAYKNKKELGSISGMVFKKALFGIWLGDDPVDSKLKKAMLGK